MIIISENVAYKVRVIGQGKPVLLLHGFTGTGETWNEFTDEFKHCYQFIIPDLIGHGKTEAPLFSERYDIANVAKDLDFILNELSIKKAAVVGYSMGGRLALTFAIRYPEKVGKLVLESASPGLETAEQQLARRKSDAELAAMITNKGIMSFIDFWENIPLFASQVNLDDVQRRRIKKERLSHDPRGLANSLIGMGSGQQPSWWGHLSHLTIPVLLLTGEWDQKFVSLANRMATLFENVENITISESGHAVHVEQSQKFGKIVNRFLSK